MKLNKLISELKRRHVFKSTIAYLAIAWVIIQIASIVFPAFNAPDYAIKILFYILGGGLPFWMIFSWMYDLTSEGFQKTNDLEEAQEGLNSTDRRLNKVIVASLATAIILLVGISFWAGSSWSNQETALDLKKVAVLPLVQKTEDKEDVYFKVGMTDALIGELSKVDQLTVISQASTQVFTSGFNSANSLISNVLREIDYYVEGEIELNHNRLNIYIKLKEKMDTQSIWQKEYSRDLSEVRILWAEVAADLARQMSVIVKTEDAELWTEFRSVKPETFELYLKGKYHMNQSTPQEWGKGMVYLQEALNKNPSDAHAYGFLAEALVNVGHGPDPPPDVFPKALAAAKRAIQLDSTVALGWAALSHYHTYFGMDWAMAEYAFNRANELNPNLADNHYHRAWYLALFGRMNEAIEEHKKAQELDPFTPMHTAWLGELYRWVGEYEKGLDEVEKVLHMEDKFGMALFVKGRILMDQGNLDQGLKTLKEASDIFPAWKMGYGSALIVSGKQEEARVIIKELEEKPITAYWALSLGVMYTLLGDFDKGLENLNHKNKAAWYPWTVRQVLMKGELSKEPRYLQLVRDMNLPDPSPLVYYPEE